MTPVYNEAKNSPCSLRFQFAAEGGWDAGGALAGGIAAAICFFGLPDAQKLLQKLGRNIHRKRTKIATKTIGTRRRRSPLVA
jgi:hypothetical protein